MKTLIRHLGPFAVLLLMVAVLLATEHDFLWSVEEHSLFLHTPLFFQQRMVVAGGLLQWAAACVTQTLFHPALGAVVLFVLWSLLLLLLRGCFRLSGQAIWLGLFPIAMLLAACTQLGYWLYFIKLPGHFFVPTLGVMLAVLLVWLFRLVCRKLWLRVAFLVVVAPLAYIALGAYGLLALALMPLAQPVRFPRRWLTLAVALIAIVAVPLIAYHTLYDQTPIGQVYTVSLPLFNHQGVSTPWLYLPYALLAAWLLAAAWFSVHPVRLRRPALAHAVVLVAALSVVAVSWNKDDNFHRELTMQWQMERQDWQGMLTTIEHAHGEPTRAMSMMKNLALLRMGRLSSQMFQFHDGRQRPAAPFPVLMVHTVGKAIYLHYGIPNYCFRWCMEDGVEYGFSVQHLKLMVKCALLSGEFTAAQRYLSLLRRTAFHRQWVAHYEAMVHNPTLIARDAELGAIVPLLRTDDFLTSDQSQLEPFLIEHLASSPGTNALQRQLQQLYFPLYLNRFSYYEH